MILLKKRMIPLIGSLNDIIHFCKIIVMDKVTVETHEDTQENYICDVIISDGNEALTYAVHVQKSDFERLTQGKISAKDLVERSFKFLLSRESKESILRSFDLMIIAKYFPEYEKIIRKEIASEQG